MPPTVKQFGCQSSVAVERETFLFKWKIQQELVVKMFDKEESSMKSSIFDPNFKDTRWFLELKYRKSSNPDRISAHLFMARENSRVEAKLSFTIKSNQSESGSNKQKSENIWHKNLHLGSGSTDCLSQSDLESGVYWIDGFLDLQCEAEVVYRTEQIENTVTISTIESISDVRDNNLRLLEQGLFSDVTLVVGDKKIKAHRCILAARSEYFDNEFYKIPSIDFNEPEVNANHIFRVPFENSTVFKSVLDYIYTGKLPENFESFSRELLVAGKLFKLKPIVGLCEQHLSENVNLNNCVDLLKFANEHNLSSLKEAAVLMIRKNLDTVIGTDDWKQLKMSNPNLIMKVFDLNLLIKS